jgi:hypothetical protein
MALTDEPVRALAALRAAIGAMRCNKQSRAYYDSVSEQLRELQAALGDSIASMQEAAAFGQTLKQGQLKALQVCVCVCVCVWWVGWQLRCGHLFVAQTHATSEHTARTRTTKHQQEFTAALASITAALSGAPGTPSSAHGGGSSDGSSAGAAVRPSASGRKPVLPDGVSTLNPDSFFHTRQSLVLALTQLLAAFKGGSPALTGAVSRAKEEVEDIGLFE